MSRGDPSRRECTDLERGGGELKLSAFCYDLPRVTHPQRPRERNIQQQFPFDGQSTGDGATLSSLAF